MSAISRRSLSKGELEAQRNLMSHDRGLAELKENAVDAEAEEAEEEKETGFYEMLLEKPVEMKNQDESLPTVTPGPVTARILVGFAEEASQYDAYTDRHVLTLPKLSSEQRFVAQTTRVTLKDGPYKGYQAIVLIPTPQQPFRFLDLHPEIRIMVYKQLYTHEGHEMAISGGTHNHPLRRGWTKPIPAGGSREVDWTSHSETSLPTSLLRVNKQLKSEASTILYSYNTIRAPSTVTLQRFLEAIGTNRTLLHQVQIWFSSGASSYSSRTALACARLLKESTLLRSLLVNLDHRSKTERPMPLHLAADLKPLFKALYRRHHSEGRVFGVVTVGEQLSCYPCAAHVRQEAQPDEACEDCRGAREAHLLDYTRELVGVVSGYLRGGR